MSRGFPIVAIAAAIASLLAVALDGVDGWLARRQRIASDFGARFDMEIDALLILVLAILVSQFEKAGAWVIVSGLLRYIFVGGRFVLAVAAARRCRRAAAGRRSASLQILALTLAILPAVEPPLSTMFAAVALGGLAVSFLVDVLWLWRARRAGDGL